MNENELAKGYLKDKLTLTVPKEKKELPFRNVALLPEDHDKLKAIAVTEQRTMTRQLSVIIRKEYEKYYDPDDTTVGS